MLFRSPPYHKQSTSVPFIRPTEYGKIHIPGAGPSDSLVSFQIHPGWSFASTYLVSAGGEPLGTSLWLAFRELRGARNRDLYQKNCSIVRNDRLSGSRNTTDGKSHLLGEIKVGLKADCNYLERPIPVRPRS